MCPGEGHYPYDKGCSNLYYKCRRDVRDILQGYLVQCPDDHVYSNVLRCCVHVKYLPMCQPCKNICNNEKQQHHLNNKHTTSEGLYINHQESFYMSLPPH